MFSGPNIDLSDLLMQLRSLKLELGYGKADLTRLLDEPIPLDCLEDDELEALIERLCIIWADRPLLGTDAPTGSGGGLVQPVGAGGNLVQPVGVSVSPW